MRVIPVGVDNPSVAPAIDPKLPAHAREPDARVAALPSVALLGVRVANATRGEACEVLEAWARARDGRSRVVYIVNAHTLNLAWEDPDYRAALNRGDVVFADGTGARMAARWRGVELRENLVGTDLVPELFTRMARDGCRVYLLGATAETVERAARHVETTWGVTVAGFHHGYVNEEAAARAAAVRIAGSGADLLLVGMGNTLQEAWIDRQRERIGTPVAIGVGGLFDHWGGNLRRASPLVRRLGIEWVQILLQQPGRKWRRYMLGNPQFLARAWRDRSTSRASAG